MFFLHGWKKAQKNWGMNFSQLQRPSCQSQKKRSPCYYSNFCGSYPCSSDAKGSSRVALLDAALKTGNLTILPNSKVFELDSDGKGKIKSVSYYDSAKQINHAQAKIFIVAAQAIETSRLLLMSKNDEFPNGISNNNGQVGKNLIFSWWSRMGAIFP